MAQGFNPYERRLLAATMGFGAQPPQQSPQPQQSLQQLLQQLQQQPQQPPALQPQQRFDASGIPTEPAALPPSQGMPLSMTGRSGSPPITGADLMKPIPALGDRLADQVNTLLAGLDRQRTPSPRDIQLAKRDALSAQRNLRAMRGPRPRPTISEQYDAAQRRFDPSGRRLSGVPQRRFQQLTSVSGPLGGEFFRRMLEKDRQEERASTARWEAGRQASIDRFNSPETQALKRRVLDRVASRRAAGDLKTATPEMLRRRAQVKTRRAGEQAQRRANVTAKAVARRGGFSTSPAAQMQRMMQTNPELFGRLAELAQQGQQFRDTGQFRRDELALRREQSQGTRQDAASALRAQMQQAIMENTLAGGSFRTGDATANREIDSQERMALNTLLAGMTTEDRAEFQATLSSALGTAGAGAVDIQRGGPFDNLPRNPWAYALGPVGSALGIYDAARSPYGPFPRKADSKRDPASGALLPPSTPRRRRQPDLNAMDILMGSGGLSR